MTHLNIPIFVQPSPTVNTPESTHFASNQPIHTTKKWATCLVLLIITTVGSLLTDTWDPQCSVLTAGHHGTRTPCHTTIFLFGPTGNKRQFAKRQKPLPSSFKLYLHWCVCPSVCLYHTSRINIAGKPVPSGCAPKGSGFYFRGLFIFILSLWVCFCVRSMDVSGMFTWVHAKD